MEKNRFSFCLFFLIFTGVLFGQVGINTTMPSPNSALHVHSAFVGGGHGGLLPPRVTLAQRNLIPVTAADDGLLVYVTLVNGSRCLQLFNGATLGWEDVKCFGVPVVPNVRELRIGADYPSTNPSSYTFTTGDIIYANTSGSGLPNRNSNNVCVGSSYRFQLLTFIVFISAPSVNEIIIHGMSSGGLRTLTTLVNFNYFNRNLYACCRVFLLFLNIDSSTICNTLSITNLSIPANTYVRFTMSGNINLSGFDLTSF